MGRQSSNLAKKERRQFELRGANMPSSEDTPNLDRDEGVNAKSRAHMARRCIEILSPKAAADYLGVNLRTIQKWASGEVDIPTDRIFPIFEETKEIFLDDLNKIETAIDRELLRRGR